MRQNKKFYKSWVRTVWNEIQPGLLFGHVQLYNITCDRIDTDTETTIYHLRIFSPTFDKPTGTCYLIKAKLLT